MKKQKITPFLLLCTVFLCFCAGLFFGRNFSQNAPAVLEPNVRQISASVNINRADAQDLMTLPGIGQTLAQRILDYRSSQGSFTSAAELLNIDGIGQTRLEALLPHITLGG